MTDTDGTAHRSLYDPTPGDIQFRDADQVDEDGMMEVRMPIASSGKVRNEGDDPLTGRELRGMAQQVDSKRLAVFPEHGNGDFVEYGKYSQFEKLGYWQDADLQREASDDGEDLLMATARMPDPEPMPKQTGDYRQALAILKEQAVRGIPISASIGWRDDEDMAGGVDLMEASIVGIGADPRTSTEGGEQLVARKAVEAGADPEALVDAVREAVSEPEDTHDMRTPDTTRTMTEFLNEQFNAEVQRRVEELNLSEAEAEQEVEDDLAAETGRDPSTIDNILNGDIECPVIDPVVEGFAEVLGFAVEDAIEAAPECDYDMSDDNGDTNEEQDSERMTREDMEERLDEMRGMIEENTELTREIRERMGEDHDDEEEEDDEDDDEQSSEQSGDEPDEEQDADPSDLEQRIAELESELEAAREGDVDVQTPQGDAEEQRDSDDDADDTDAESQAARSERDAILGVNQ